MRLAIVSKDFGKHESHTNFDRERYLTFISELGKELKIKFGHNAYWRTFSEPRKKTAYRSKFWSSGENVFDYILENYGHILNVKWAGTSAPGCCHQLSVAVTPKSGTFFKSSITEENFNEVKEELILERIGTPVKGTSKALPKFPATVVLDSNMDNILDEFQKLIDSYEGIVVIDDLQDICNRLSEL